jgi:subtilisin family serine protease
MMEIVHDMAPGANLIFATAGTGAASFANNILALAAAGSKVIVDDFTYFNEGVFQDGTIAQAVNQVAANGVVYISSAANSGNLTNSTSGTWEGDFLNGGPVTGVLATAGETGFFHNFGTAATPQNFDVLTVTSTFMSLKWSDPLGGSTNDYDLFVLNNAGTTIKGFSAGVQSGTQDPFESVRQGTNCGTSTASGYCPVAGDRFVVVLFSGAARALHLDTERGQLSLQTDGATFGHNAGVNTVSMAATYWNSAHTGTRPFTGFGNPDEVFSSDGPRKIFFTPNGSAITPGNFLFGTNGGLTLQKPDFAAADGVSTKTPGFTPFLGTSAAAPHAAGIAALILSARPDYSPSQVKAALTATALDSMTLGIDRDSGYGVMMALAAVQYALTH